MYVRHRCCIHTTRLTYIPTIMIFPLYALLFLSAVISAGRIPQLSPQSNAQEVVLLNIRVPVQLGVMSRCPDALLCESRFNQVLDKVSDKVDLSLVYVAKYPNSSDHEFTLIALSYRLDSSQPDFGVWCMHGPDECAGNIQQLCVAKYAPPENWWEFVQCQNYQGRENIGDSDLALKCAKTARIDWENGGAGYCAGLDGSGRGREGVQLLKESASLGQELGIMLVIPKLHLTLHFTYEGHSEKVVQSS